MLSEEFLKPYREAGDCFPNLLARATYLSKFCRNGESWTDTVKRVVEDNVSKDPNVSEDEAEELFDAIWNMRVMPPGRGLWTGGVAGMHPAAKFNCWGTVLDSPEEWCWTADMLMLGGGVGVSLLEIDKLPVVKGFSRLYVGCSSEHPNVGEVQPDFVGDRVYSIPDSREGWVDALRTVLAAGFSGRDARVDVTGVRERGAPIRTFGGVACGPGPLVHLLRKVNEILNGAIGRKLNSVECLDITNYVGLCIRSGNVRRSALIVVGQPDDQAFRDAKKDFAAVLSHRSTSNNSIAVRGDENWTALVHDMSEYGEPGILNFDRARADDEGAVVVNPCFEASTLVHTRQGHYRIDELVGKTVDVWDGKTWRLATTFAETSQDEEMLKFTMHDGSSFRVTKYHTIVTADGQRIEAKDVEVGEKLLISNAPAAHGEVVEPGAYLKGFAIGDGTISHNGPILWLYKPKYMCTQRILASLGEVPIDKARRSDCIVEPGVTTGEDRCHVQGMTRRSQQLTDWVTTFKKALPAQVFEWCHTSKVEFIAGVMDADGNASDTTNGFMYQVCSVERLFLEQFQTLLKTIGVHSKLALMKSAGTVNMSDGYGEYNTQDCWRLTISQQSAIVLANQCKFERLQSFADKKTTYNLKPKFNKVVDIQPDGVDAKVYCLVTDDPDQIALSNGLILGRCGEIFLHKREACCLVEFFPSRCESLTAARRAAVLATRYCLRQRLDRLPDPESDAKQQANMRLGVAIGGVCDFDWNTRTLDRLYLDVRCAADDYSLELGVNAPIAVTCIKPSGTISLLAGASPGMHAPFAPYYIRRARFASNDPMVAHLVAAGVPMEPDQYDQTLNTLVASFPIANPGLKVYVANETVDDQITRLVDLQNHWADNAVSATVSFEKHEEGRLAQLLDAHIQDIKSVSCLPKAHGYTQAPYEEITKEQYDSLVAGIDNTAKLTYGGDVLVDECSTGACPIR